MWGEGFWSWLRHHAPGGATSIDVSPDDAEELGRAAARVASEFAIAAPEVIVVAAGRLLRRQVPASALRGTAQAPGVADLQFADGTVLTVLGEHSGDLGRLAVRLMHGRVLLEGCEASASGVTLQFAPTDRPLRLRAVGVARPG